MSEPNPIKQRHPRAWSVAVAVVGLVMMTVSFCVLAGQVLVSIARGVLGVVLFPLRHHW